MRRPRQRELRRLRLTTFTPAFNRVIKDYTFSFHSEVSALTTRAPTVRTILWLERNFLLFSSAHEKLADFLFFLTAYRIVYWHTEVSNIGILLHCQIRQFTTWLYLFTGNFMLVCERTILRRASRPPRIDTVRVGGNGSLPARTAVPARKHVLNASLPFTILSMLTVQCHGYVSACAFT